jgi:FixJ family two-component response regulator
MYLEQLFSEVGAEVVGPAFTVEQACDFAEAQSGLSAAVLNGNLKGHWVGPALAMLRARGVPVVMVTGSTDRTEIPAGVPIISKPFEPGHLIEVVAQVVANDASTDDAQVA